MLFEELAYIIYVRERYLKFLVCTSRKTIDFSTVKVDVPKGALKFRENLTIDVLVHPIHISSNVVIWSQSLI